MPEQKLSYEDRVDKAAETYANSYNSYVDFDVDFKDKSDFQYEGKKAIAAQADAIREFNKHFIPNWMEENEPFSDEVIDLWLLEHGYIEPKTEDDEHKRSN